MSKIYQQKDSHANENDRLALATLLIKLGYKVRIGKEKKEGKSTYIYFIEYEEQK